MFEPEKHPHRRYNPLTGEWVVVSPQRLQRPWRGQVADVPVEQRPAYDPGCYLCPGNVRATGARNPTYETTYVFDNDYPSLLAQPLDVELNSDPLFRPEPVHGTSRVVCYAPRHDLTLPEMPVEAIRGVVDTWAGQVSELGASFPWVQIFENKGSMMGCSNAHPHGQIWATSFLPTEALKEERQQRHYFEAHGSALLVDYEARERTSGERTVVANDDWQFLVPFWAAWPFEVLLVPHRPVSHLPDLTAAERDSLSAILKEMLTRYDNLFDTSFPYAMGWHGAPQDGDAYPHWQLHAHFYPPLLRSATVRKFMVGFEMLGEVQRDLTPEAAAARLRDLDGQRVQRSKSDA